MADGWSTQWLTPELDGFLMTSVVIPLDSEIVVKFSVSGIRPHGCTLVEPARCLTEEYGVVVGHTLVRRLCRSTRKKSSGALTRRWVTQADNYFGTCYFAIVMFFRRRGSQLPAGPRQFNMILLRRTPGQFAAAHDGWPLPDSERNRHVCGRCCKGDKL